MLVAPGYFFAFLCQTGLCVLPIVVYFSAQICSYSSLNGGNIPIRKEGLCSPPLILCTVFYHRHVVNSTLDENRKERKKKSPQHWMHWPNVKLHCRVVITIIIATITFYLALSNKTFLLFRHQYYPLSISSYPRPPRNTCNVVKSSVVKVDTLLIAPAAAHKRILI